MSIVVTTPTGQIGSRVVERLLADGRTDVAVVARNPERLSPAVRERVEVREGTLEDAAFLRGAFAGADVVFLLVPPPGPEVADWGEWQRAIGRGAAEAVRAGGVRRVVLLSSGGAHRGDLYAVSRLGEIERMLRDAAPDVASLRAGFFAENFLAAVPTIRDFGSVFMQFAPEQALSIVSTRDIGDVAARWLADGAWSGHHEVGVYGGGERTLAEAAAVFAGALERPVSYVRIGAEQLRGALQASGAPAAVVDEYPKMFEALAEIGMERPEAEVAEHDWTPLETWAREVLRPAYDAAARTAAAT